MVVRLGYRLASLLLALCPGLNQINHYVHRWWAWLVSRHQNSSFMLIWSVWFYSSASQHLYSTPSTYFDLRHSFSSLLHRFRRRLPFGFISNCLDCSETRFGPFHQLKPLVVVRKHFQWITDTRIQLFDITAIKIRPRNHQSSIFSVFSAGYFDLIPLSSYTFGSHPVCFIHVLSIIPFRFRPLLHYFDPCTYILQVHSHFSPFL